MEQKLELVKSMAAYLAATGDATILDESLREALLGLRGQARAEVIGVHFGVSARTVYRLTEKFRPEAGLVERVRGFCVQPRRVRQVHKWMREKLARKVTLRAVGEWLELLTVLGELERLNEGQPRYVQHIRLH